MKKTINEILYRITEEILERLAFILSFPEDALSPLSEEDATIACVSFTGPFSGKVILLISTEVLPELAGNMLGLDNGEVAEEIQQQDALKELINVVCGNLLPEIAGTEAVFNVGTPEIITDIASVAGNHDPLGATQLPLEEGQCDLNLFIDGTIPENLKAFI